VPLQQIEKPLQQVRAIDRHGLPECQRLHGAWFDYSAAAHAGSDG
jgi:hypothetical protein